MNFLNPIPFEEALQSREIKQILPTTAKSAELMELAPELRERAFFSARVTNAELLQKLDNTVDDLLQARTDPATARLRLKEYITSIDSPLPSVRAGLVSALPEGPITDITSTARLDLILDTNLKMAQGYGNWKQGQNTAVLDQWPAQELFRAESRDDERDWYSRWRAAGGRLFGARMIALKNDPIWTDISAFGTPYPPFDFNSGMDVRDIDRDEAISLDLIDRDTQIAPEDRPFNQDLQAAAPAEGNLLAQLLTDLAGRAIIEQGVLKMLPGRLA